jgi:hypothetical protein
MVGIEQCRGFIVGRSFRAAFEREFAGRILMVTAGAQALPGISYVAYKRASGPFYLYYWPKSEQATYKRFYLSHQSHKSKKIPVQTQKRGRLKIKRRSFFILRRYTVYNKRRVLEE